MLIACNDVDHHLSNQTCGALPVVTSDGIKENIILQNRLKLAIKKNSPDSKKMKPYAYVTLTLSFPYWEILSTCEKICPIVHSLFRSFVRV